jgi:hypothetical protein
MSKELISKALIKTAIERIPDLNSYVANLNKLKSLDFRNSEASYVHDRFFELATILPINFAFFHKEKFNKLKFYRVRSNIDQSKEDISLINTYSYPPQVFCNENGRANLKGKTVFYCSNNPNAAIYESKSKIGEEGSLSVWTANSDRTIYFGVCLPYDLKPSNDWNLVASDIFIKQLIYYQAEAKDKLDHFKALNKFISDIFVSENKPYPLTSMISNEYLYRTDHNPLDFLLYPSITSNLNYCNMAFHPNAVNENLKFEKVIRFKIINITSERISFNFGKVGFLEGTEMKWRNYNEEDVVQFVKEKNSR